MHVRAHANASGCIGHVGLARRNESRVAFARPGVFGRRGRVFVRRLSSGPGDHPSTCCGCASGLDFVNGGTSTHDGFILDFGPPGGPRSGTVALPLDFGPRGGEHPGAPCPGPVAANFRAAPWMNAETSALGRHRRGRQDAARAARLSCRPACSSRGGDFWRCQETVGVEVPQFDDLGVDRHANDPVTSFGEEPARGEMEPDLAPVQPGVRSRSLVFFLSLRRLSGRTIHFRTVILRSSATNAAHRGAGRLAASKKYPLTRRGSCRASRHNEFGSVDALSRPWAPYGRAQFGPRRFRARRARIP